MTVKLTEKSEFSPAATYFNWPENLARRWEHMGLPVLLRTAWQEGFVSGMGGGGGGWVRNPLTPTPTSEGDICRESRAHSSVLGLCCDLLYHHCTMHIAPFTILCFYTTFLSVSYLKVSVLEDRGSNPDVWSWGPTFSCAVKAIQNETKALTMQAYTQ